MKFLTLRALIVQDTTFVNGIMFCICCRLYFLTHTHAEIVIYRDWIWFFFSTLMGREIAIIGCIFLLLVDQIFAGHRYRIVLWSAQRYSKARTGGSAELIFSRNHFANMLDFFPLAKVSFVLTFNVDTGARVQFVLSFSFQRETTRRCFRFQKNLRRLSLWNRFVLEWIYSFLMKHSKTLFKQI